MLPCHASLNRTCIILDCASCHVYVMVFTMLFASFRFASLVSFGFVPELWGFVRLRPFVFFMESFFFLAGFQARWSYPRNHYYLCYASLLALLPCHASLNRTCIILDCASCHDYACVFTMLFASFRFASLVTFGFVPELWGFVRLRSFVFFMDSFFFLEGFQARWPLPWVSLLSLLC